MKQYRYAFFPVDVSRVMTFGIGIFFGVMFAFCGWTSVNVELDSTDLVQGRPFRLIISMDASSQVLPDFSPLEKEFNILGSEQSTSVSIVNNKIQSQTRWVLYLSTSRSGTLQIPSLTIDGQRTDPISLTINPASSAPMQTRQNNGIQSTSPHSSPLKVDKLEDVMLQVEVDNKQPYLNQQVLYTMRLFNRRRLVDVEYLPPEANNALMFPLGESRRYETTVQDKRYAIEEQKFMVFPLQSGNITIKPPQFSALIYDGFPQRIRPQAKALQLEVKSVPDTLSVENWLPAAAVELDEEYNTKSNKAFAGDSIVREVTIKALGMTSELLPEYHFVAPDGVKVYVDKPERKNYLQNNQVLGTARFKITYLFNQPGDYDIPPVNIQWFNTKTAKIEKATLSGRSIKVVAENGKKDPVEKAERNNPSQLLSAKATEDTAKDAPHKITVSHSLFWMMLSLLTGFGLAWAIFAWKMRKNKPLASRSARALVQSLRRACIANDAKQVQSLFLQWARLRWPETPPLNLGDASSLIADKAMIAQLNILIHALYQPQAVEWSGKAFWKTFTLYSAKKPSKASSKSNLPPINPY